MTTGANATPGLPANPEGGQRFSPDLDPGLMGGGVTPLVPHPALASVPAPPVITNTIQNTIIMEQSRPGPGWLGTGLWFIFFGSWLSGLWILAAWVLIALIITMPLGLAMLNMVPKIATLREPSRELKVTIDGTVTRIQQVAAAQLPFLARTVYFLFVGIWLSAVWLFIAWLTSLTIIGLPLTIWMYNRVPAVTTLKRY
jgi:uncharacterized membrane protein YccF (DUF307 family)